MHLLYVLWGLTGIFEMEWYYQSLQAINRNAMLQQN